jgi:hypothetical protein
MLGRSAVIEPSLWKRQDLVEKTTGSIRRQPTVWLRIAGAALCDALVFAEANGFSVAIHSINRTNY